MKGRCQIVSKDAVLQRAYESRHMLNEHKLCEVLAERWYARSSKASQMSFCLYAGCPVWESD